MKKLCFIIISIILVSMVPGGVAYADNSTLNIYFLDVGQGDATLFISNDDVMLIDTGPDEGLTALRDRLVECGVNTIDYLVITHPHEDHDSNLEYLADNYTIAHLVMPEYADDEEDYGDLLREMVGQGTQIVYPNVGDQYVIGGLIATVLSAADPSRFPDDMNLWSVVLRVDCGDISVLMTGDAEDINEFEMIDAGLDLDTDIFKVGHHGSTTSSSGAFVAAVSPEYAVISCGADNKYGHPDAATLATLQECQADVLRTDLNGTICFVTDGSTYTISPKCEPSTAVEEDSTEQTYILNTSSKKFHYPTCSSVDQMSEKNKAEYTGTRDELIEQGYSPCGRCKP